MLDDHQGALADLNKANILKPNNAFTLNVRAYVKRMFGDYQGALEDLDKVNVIGRNNPFTLTVYAHTNWSLNNIKWHWRPWINFIV